VIALLRVRSRPAFTLIESIVVLSIVAVLITSFTFMKRPEKQTWSRFEREFKEAYMLARQKQVGSQEAFYIAAKDEYINVDGRMVRAPAEWLFGKRTIRCKVFTMVPTSIALFNAETMRRRHIVFQLGGGTYHIET
jgi:prepilin-type N-terminal cleavage/methylation domain-containing protein